MQNTELKKSIVDLLHQTAQPLAVENIRVGCKIGNWQTALKHCLELLLAGEIRGVKTSKSWVFWDRSRKLSSKQTMQALGFKRRENTQTGGGQ